MKRRADSAFGLHFDFHANPERCGASAIGGTLREDKRFSGSGHAGNEGHGTGLVCGAGLLLLCQRGG